ncbi:hypothetical protein SEA_SUCHA_57 [Microbacterium phage Sucha]|nr:hypothetical protein SEA_SUCHA_57 [Microbacterium phage Sucha]
MNETIKTLEELHEHLRANGNKAVILDVARVAFQVQLYPSIVATEDFQGEDALIAASLGADERGAPMLYAADLLKPVVVAALVPAFPVSVLANR